MGMPERRKNQIGTRKARDCTANSR